MKQTSYYKRIHTDGENYWFGKQVKKSLRALQRDKRYGWK